MPIHIMLTPAGVLKKAETLRHVNSHRQKFLEMQPGAIFDLCSKPEEAFQRWQLQEDIANPLRSSAAMIFRTGVDNKIILHEGANFGLENIFAMADIIGKLPPEKRPLALLHIIQTYYFAGMPRDSLKNIQDALMKFMHAKPGEKIEVEIVATGAGSARGIAGTGNLGAVALLHVFARLLGGKVCILNGGQGTRLFGLEKLKGDVALGPNMNLAIWNVLYSFYHLSQMPQVMTEQKLAKSALAGVVDNQKEIDALWTALQKQGFIDEHGVINLNLFDPDGDGSLFKKIELKPSDQANTNTPATPTKLDALQRKNLFEIMLLASLDYIATFPNDGIYVPHGMLTCRGIPLKEVGTIPRSAMAFLFPLYQNKALLPSDLNLKQDEINHAIDELKTAGVIYQQTTGVWIIKPDVQATLSDNAQELLKTATNKQDKAWKALIDNGYMVQSVDNDAVQRGILQPKFKGMRRATKNALQAILKEICRPDEFERFFNHLKNRGTAKEGYFCVSPDPGDAGISEEESKRFGMVAFDSDGNFLCATEKEGRNATLAKAQERLQDLGKSPNTKVCIFFNYYGMTTSRGVETALQNAMELLIKPYATIDELGDLDTYSLIFATLSSSDAADFRKAIEKQPKLLALFPEPTVDEKVYPALRHFLLKGLTAEDFMELIPGQKNEARGKAIYAALQERLLDAQGILRPTFKPDHNDIARRLASVHPELKLTPSEICAIEDILMEAFTEGQCRFGFANFNQHAVIIDVGMLPALFGFYSDMVRSYPLTGVERDHYWQIMGQLERGMQLSQGDQNAIATLQELENLQNIKAQVTRTNIQRIVGFDATAAVENAELTPVKPGTPPHKVPVLGVFTDPYARARRSGAQADEAPAIQEKVVGKLNAKLHECRLKRDTDGKLKLVAYEDIVEISEENEKNRGQLLFYFDPDGIQTIKIQGRINPGAVIGRDTLIMDSEIGEGVIIAEGGKIVGSKVTHDITLPPPDTLTQDMLEAKVQEMSDAGSGTYKFRGEGGWEIHIVHNGTERGGKLVRDIARNLQQMQEDRKCGPELECLQRMLGLKRRYNFEFRRLGTEVLDAQELTAQTGSTPIKFSGSVERHVDKDSHTYMLEARYVAPPKYIYFNRESTSPLVVGSLHEERLGWLKDKVPAVWKALKDAKIISVDNYGNGTVQAQRMYGIRNEAALKTALNLKNLSDPEVVRLYKELQEAFKNPDIAYIQRCTTGQPTKVLYEVPFTADPAKTYLAMLGGITFKDPKAQDNLAPLSAWEFRPLDELKPMAGEIADKIQVVVRQLPAVAGMPRAARSPAVTIDTQSLKTVIEKNIDERGVSAAGDYFSLCDEISDELSNQSINILTYLIKNILTARKETVAPAKEQAIKDALTKLFKEEAEKRQKSTMDSFIKDITNNTAAREEIKRVLQNFPYCERIFEDYGYSIETFEAVIQATLAQFYIKKVSLCETLNCGRIGSSAFNGFPQKDALWEALKENGFIISRQVRAGNRTVTEEAGDIQQNFYDLASASDPRFTSALANTGLNQTEQAQVYQQLKDAATKVIVSYRPDILAVPELQGRGDLE